MKGFTPILKRRARLRKMPETLRQASWYHTCLIECCNRIQLMIRPIPAERREFSSGPRPAQQAAGWPPITIAGTERIPSLFALFATAGSCMSSTMTLQEEQAKRLTIWTASLQAGHPALKISIKRFLFIVRSHFFPALRVPQSLLGV